LTGAARIRGTERSVAECRGIALCSSTTEAYHIGMVWDAADMITVSPVHFRIVNLAEEQTSMTVYSWSIEGMV